MVTRDTAWPAGTPCWVDLATPDMADTKAFYRAVFGWDIEEGAAEYGGYANASAGGKLVAGIMPKQSADQPTVWTTYLCTEDADATAAKIRQAGGQVIMEVMDVAEFGRMAVAVDPGGAMFGIWQPGSHTGVQRANEPNSVSWNENMSRAYEANQKFYADVFGYKYDDMSADGFQYATFATAGGVSGGIGALPDSVPAEVPANWTVYFGVDDTEAALKKVTELGGSVVRPAEDTPYGRMATVADPHGAVFAIISIAPQDS